VIVSLHGRIVADAAERGVDHFARDAVVDRDLLEGFEPIVESFGACAAFGGARGPRAKDGRHYGREEQGFQISSSHRQLRFYHKSLGTRSARGGEAAASQARWSLGSRRISIKKTPVGAVKAMRGSHIRRNVGSGAAIYATRTRHSAKAAESLCL
jgi:hypothetical protein